MNKIALGCVAALILPVAALAAPEPKSIPYVNTGPFKHVDGSGPARDAQNILLHQRNLTSLSAPGAAVSMDIGDVAVIVDNGSIILQPAPANLYDLAAGTAITFAPGVDSFTVTNSGLGLDAGIGGNLGLGDDATTPVAIGFSFPFLGVDYNTIHVNSDGNITLGSGDGSSVARDAARLVSGPPRIAPLYVDLDPTSGGSVNADVRADSVVVTWTGVPQFGIADSNTFQVVLHSDGTIDMVLDSVEASVAVVGVAEGGGEEPFNEVDLSDDLPTTQDAGAIFEEFAPATVGKQFDIFAAANEFYATHDDKYDFLVFFTDWVPNLGGAFAFHQGVQNLTFGLGNRAVFDGSSAAGSAGELESLLMMNRIGLYWPDAKKLVNPPIKKFRFTGQVPGATLDGPPGPTQISRRARRMGTLGGDFGGFGAYTLGLNSAMSIMAQEAGHRWLAFPLFVHPTKGLDFFGGLPEAFDLLGRSNAHWSFFFNVTVPPGQFGGDTRASSEEGNAILDLDPNPTLCESQNLFRNARNELIDGFTKLDQYLMGLIPSDDVGEFWYVDNPTTIGGTPFGPGTLGDFSGQPAQDDVAYCGDRVNLTVADITAVDGAFPFPFPNNGPRFFIDRDTGLPVSGELGDEFDQVGGVGPGVRDVKTMAFILVTEQVPGKKSSAVSQVDTFRETWETYANGPATAGLGRFDTSLDPEVY